MDKRTDNRLRDLERGVQELRTDASRRPVRDAKMKGGSSGNVIYAQVNEGSGVSSGDPTFSFDNAVALVGSIPAGGTGTAQNQYAQAYANDEWVILHQRKDNEQWLTELAGGTSGSQVIHFELTEDMGYADLAKLAKPVNDDGTLDSGADAFYVVDMRAVDTGGDFGEFYGRTTYTDADTGAVVWSGYQGYAVRFTDDWDETGSPGYKIITMDQPADFWIGTVAESLTGSPLAAKATYDDTIDPSGSPFSGRRPPMLADSRVTVYDDLNLKPVAGEKWVIKWDKINERYVYWFSLKPRYHVIKGTSPGVVRADSTFTLGSPAVVQGVLPTGTVTVECDPKVYCPNGETIYARWDQTLNTGAGGWTTADAGNHEWIMKGHVDYDEGATDGQPFEHVAGVLRWGTYGDCDA
jgi:hypothetical protein